MEKFRQVYGALYSSSDSSAEMNVIKEKLRGLINPESANEALRISGSIVKKAAGLMKKGKSDVWLCN